MYTLTLVHGRCLSLVFAWSCACVLWKMTLKIRTVKGNDDPEAGSDGRPKDNVVRDNTLTSPDQIIYLKNSDNNIITVS